jgi:hypothetical protein
MNRHAVRLVLVAALCHPLSACARDHLPQLGEPVTLVEHGASNPTVAVDPRNGTVYVAWVGSAEGDGNVYVSRSTDGIAFDPPVRANHVAGDAAPHEQAPAQVEVGPEGNVYVVWQKNTAAPGRRFPYSDLRLARSVDGGRAFEPAMTVNDDAGTQPSSHTFHDVLAGPDGTVWVSWIDGRARAAAEAGAEVNDQHGTHGGHGEDGLPGQELRIARSDDGGRTFGTSTVVAGDICPCCRTALALSPEGELYVGWRTVLANNVRDVVLARSTDRGVTWTAATRVHSDDWVFDACPHAGPSVAVDAAGRVHVAWYTGAEQRPGIYTAASSDRGVTFGAPAALLTGEWVPPSQVKLAADASGMMVLVWDDRRREESALRIGYRLAGSAPIVRTADATRGTSPAIATGAGRIAVAWLDGDAVRVRSSAADAAHVAAR